MAPEEQSTPTLECPDSQPEQQNAEELLSALDASAASSGRSSPERAQSLVESAQRLAEERLGMVGALFVALGCKHPATAAHSLRVALACSRWAAAIGMPEKLRMQLEAAALLHDIGKIAVPDSVLTKPGRLTPMELRSIDHSSEAARRILAAAQAPQAIIDGVASTLAWYDGTHRSIKTKGEHAPYISRMIAIVDAFDSMTSDQVYRSALPHERAIAALYENAGTQFDPGLVTSFVESLEKNANSEHDLEERWVSNLNQPDQQPLWLPSPLLEDPDAESKCDASHAFAVGLIAASNDAVVYVDDQLKITYWNEAAEKMTGVGAQAAEGTMFSPGMIALSRDSGEFIEDELCPVKRSVENGLQTIDRVNAVAAGGRPVSIDMHVIPMRDGAELIGAAVVMHDASSETSLERRCQSLHMENAKDPLTQVANRAEFDRMLPTFADVHQEIGLPFSLIMTDIDRFKRINDTFGHQSGDEAIKEFASLLKSMCRSGDLVARYGGEEFAILCADCNVTIAHKRADQIRERLAALEHDYLDGESFTASFGVTEMQVGDTPDSILRRADRALLQAKDQGRNQVVQLGNGMTATDSSNSKSWFGGIGSWFSVGGKKTSLVETKLVTNVPIEMAVEKLRGFIADRDAQILKADKNQLRLEVTDQEPAKQGKKQSKNDRAPLFVLDLKLSQEHIEKSNSSGFATGTYAHTFIEVQIKAKQGKNTSKAQLAERARLMLGNLQSYVMAHETNADKSDYTPAAPETADDSTQSETVEA